MAAVDGLKANGWERLVVQNGALKVFIIGFFDRSAIAEPSVVDQDVDRAESIF
jgi:hypothetical protein